MADNSNSDSDNRYHTTDSKYVLPNDVLEHTRLDHQAAAIVELIGGHPFLAPIQTIHERAEKVVDVGCGTGAATLQMATVFRSAKTYGLDISAVPERSRSIAPANVHWVTGNVLDVDTAEPADDPISREIFTAGSLDYIFGRMLILGINDWRRYFAIAAASLRPGGIIEHQDIDWPFYRAQSNERISDDWQWCRAFTSASEKSGLSMQAGSQAAALMQDVGLEIISIDTFEWWHSPSSKIPSSQVFGRYAQTSLAPIFPELLRKVIGSDSIGEAELDKLIEECKGNLASEEGLHQKYTVTVAIKR